MEIQMKQVMNNNKNKGLLLIPLRRRSSCLLRFLATMRFSLILAAVKESLGQVFDSNERIR